MALQTKTVVAWLRQKRFGRDKNVNFDIVPVIIMISQSTPVPRLVLSAFKP